jgi:hypothetical protein
MIQELGVTMNLVYEDPRYPTLVIEGNNFAPLGYSLDLDTGKLARVCICHAHSENECICGAWNDIDE